MEVPKKWSRIHPGRTPSPAQVREEGGREDSVESGELIVRNVGGEVEEGEVRE
jgi:hypothetical protein